MSLWSLWKPRASSFSPLFDLEPSEPRSAGFLSSSGDLHALYRIKLASNKTCGLRSRLGSKTISGTVLSKRYSKAHQTRCTMTLSICLCMICSYQSRNRHQKVTRDVLERMGRFFGPLAVVF